MQGAVLIGQRPASGFSNLRERIIPFLKGAIEKEIREHGHCGDRQKANRNEVDKQTSFYFRTELPFAALTSQLQQVTNKDKREDYEGDEVECGKCIKDKRVRRSIRADDGPQPQLL